MKKAFYMMAAAAIALSSCSSEETYARPPLDVPP